MSALSRNVRFREGHLTPESCSGPQCKKGVINLVSLRVMVRIDRDNVYERL